jgi:single-stranded-DNA-specific exonuclease
VESLVNALEIPPTLAGLLVQRGYLTPDDAKRFLRPTLESLSDPFELRHMDRAVESVARAVREGQTIPGRGSSPRCIAHSDV